MSFLFIELNFHLLSREYLSGPLENTQMPASPATRPCPSAFEPLHQAGGLAGPRCLFCGQRQRICAANVTSNLPCLSLRAGASLLFLTKHFQSTLGFLHGWLNCLCLFRTLLLFLCPAADLSVSSLEGRKLTGPCIWLLARSSGEDFCPGKCLGC